MKKFIFAVVAVLALCSCSYNKTVEKDTIVDTSVVETVVVDSANSDTISE